MISNISLKEYKKIKVREVIRAFINQPKFQEMKKQLTSIEKINKWNKFSSFQQRQNLIEKFLDIEQLQKIDQNDFMLVQLESLMKTKSNQVQNLFSPIPYEHLIHIIYQKKGLVHLQDLKSLTYTSNKTYRNIYEKIIQDSSFISWRQKHFKSQIQDTRMEVQQSNQFRTPLISENRDQKLMQSQISIKKPSIKKKTQSQTLYTAEYIHQEKTKISNWITKIKQKYGDHYSEFLEVKILKHMLNLLENKEKVKLHQIEKLIKNEQRWNSDLEDFFEKQTNGDVNITIVLSSTLGFVKLKEIFQMMLSVNIFELEERCQLSKFENLIECGLFIVGNTGVGKTTLGQSLIGYKHNKEKDSYGKITLNIAGQLRKEHERLIAGSSSESITTFLTSVSFVYKNKLINFIDTPGFQDTKGPLADIANQIMLQKAFQMSRYTAYLILTELNKLESERYRGIKQLVFNIAKRFEYSSFDQLKGFVLLIFSNKFNRISQEEIHNIRVVVQQFNQDQEIMRSPKKKIALQLVIKSLLQNRNFFDPFKKQSITDIKDMISQMNFNRNNKIQTSFENNTKHALRETIRFIKKNMERSTESCPLKKKQFYYDLLFKLHNLIPNEIQNQKKEIDYILERQSNKIFELICQYLNQRIKFKKFNQDQFLKFISNVQKLKEYEVISLLNPSIKSNKQINQQIFQFLKQYIRNIIQILQQQQAKNQQRFINHFEKYFGSLLSLVQAIKNAFVNRISQTLQLIKVSFNEADTQYYTKCITCVQKLLKISNQINLNLDQSEFIKLLSYYQSIILQKYNNLLKGVSQIVNWLSQNNDQVLKLEKLYEEYAAYSKFNTLTSDKTKEIVQNQIMQIILKVFANIVEQFQLFMNFPGNFYQQRSLHACKIKQLQKLTKLNIQSIKKEAVTSYKAMQDCFSRKIKIFYQQLDQILNAFRNNEINKKQGKSYFLRNRIQTIICLGQYFINQQLMINKIKLMHSQYCKEFNKKSQFLEQFTIEKMAYYKENQVTNIIRDLTVIQSYGYLDPKDFQTFEKIKSIYKSWVKKSLVSLSDYFLKTKFSNLQELKNKFNKKIIKYLRQSIINSLIPIQSYLCKLQLLEELYNVYCSVRGIFQSLQEKIKDGIVISKENEEIEAQKKINNYVQTLCYVYQILKKQINVDNAIKQFLINPHPNISLPITISTTQLEKQIEEIYISKYNQLTQKLYAASETISNLSNLNRLKNQSLAWKKLEDLLKKQNKQISLQNKENLNDLLQLFCVKIAKIEKRQLSKMQAILDKQHCCFRNIPQIAKVYKDLKESYESKIFSSSQQNFEVFLETLAMCAHSKRREIKNQLNHLQGDDISLTFLINFEEFIELYQVLISCISQNDMKKFNCSFVKDIREAITTIIKKLDFFWSSSVSTVQKMIQERQFVKANKMINLLNNQKELIQNFQKLEIQRIQSYQNQQKINIINLEKYQHDLRSLQQKRDYEQKNRDKFIANPFQNEEHTIRIISLYNKQNQLGRMKLRRKIREDFTRKLQAYKNLERDQDNQIYFQLYTLIDKIPVDIVRDNNWNNQIQKIKKDKLDKENFEIKEVTDMKLDDLKEKRQLFALLNNNKSLRLLKLVLYKIKQLVFSTQTSIRSTNSSQMKINAFNQLTCLFNNVNACNTIKEQFKNNLQNFQKGMIAHFQSIIQVFFQNIQNSINNKALSEKISKQYVKDRMKLLYFVRTYRQNQSLEQINILISYKKFISFLMAQFKTVCPLRKTLKQLNSQIFPLNLIKQVQSKLLIYNQIADSIIQFQLDKKQRLQDFSPNNQIMVEQQDDKMQIQLERNNYFLTSMTEISEQIHQFKNQLKNRKENIINELKRFKFRDESLYYFDDKLKIQKKIRNLQNMLVKGLNFQYFKQINPQYVILQNEIQLLKDSYSKQFNDFAQQNIRKYIQFLQKPEKEMPKSFQYFQYLTFYLVQQKLEFIKMLYKIDQNTYIVNDNPYQKLYQVIKNLSNKYLRQMKALQVQIVKEHKLIFKDELQNRLKDLQMKLQVEKDNLQKDKKQKNMNIDFQMVTSKTKKIGQQKNKIQREYNRALQNLNQKYQQMVNKLQAQVADRQVNSSKYLEYLVRISKMIKKSLNNELILFLQNKIKQEIKQFIFKNKLSSLFQIYFQKFEKNNNYIVHLRKLLQMPNLKQLKSFQKKLNSRSSNQIIQRISKKSQEIISDKDTMSQEVKEFQKELKNIKSSVISKNKKIKDLVKQINGKNRIQTLALIAAVWSLHKSIKKQKSEFFWSSNLHQVQILSLLLFTRRQEDEDGNLKDQNMLVNIKPGEGKSLTIAILATYYALNGFNVSIACYSSEISQKIYRNFAFLFQACLVTSKIQYESFHMICQKYLMNFLEQAQLKNLLTLQNKGFLNNLMEKTKGFFKSKKVVNNKQILLCDQIEMLWARDHRKSPLSLTSKLNLPEFNRIIKYVWDQVKGGKLPQPDEIYNLEDFQSLKNRYPNLKNILQFNINALLIVFENQTHHSYNVYQSKIHYLDKESSLKPIHFGYQTMFNYLSQYQAKNISLSNLEKQLFLPIHFGNFSYTETVKIFQRIQGVTSGLQVIQDNKKEFLSKNYSFSTSNMYLMPSIYQQTEEETILQYKICNNSSLCTYICQSILQKQDWPVLICFKNYESLRKFQENSQFKNLHYKYKTIHYMKNASEREEIANGAGEKNSVTLITSEFLWGLNIEIASDLLDSKGNLHLILTYIPKSFSELESIKGRTGRKGEYGLINFIFNLDQYKTKLKQLNQTVKIPQRQDKVQQCLKQFYKINDSLELNPNTSKLSSFEDEHKANIVQYQKDNKTSLQRLMKLNTTDFVLKKYNITFAIQGTKSMKDLLTILQHNIKDIFSQVDDLRKKMNIKYSFQIDLLLYTNYDRLGKTIQGTLSYQAPDKISQFIKVKKLELQEDQPSSALEVALRMINQRRKVDMIFILGNSRPNSSEEIEDYMQRNSWKQYSQKEFLRIQEQFYIRRDLQAQVKLLNKKLVINGLTLANRQQKITKNQFLGTLTQLCENFRGTAQQVDISDKEAQSKIVKYFVTNILYVLNGCKQKELINKLYVSQIETF